MGAASESSGSPRSESPAPPRASKPGLDLIASAVAVPNPPSEDEKEFSRKLRVLGSLAGWFFLNAIFAIYNKKTLNCFPYPWILSWIQIATGAALMLVLWATKLVKPPEGGLTMQKCKALIPTSILHLIAHVSACCSYSLSSVSITQVVKAAEPVCSVVLLTVLFGARFSVWSWMSLLPITLGVAYSSATEINFSMLAFVMAMISNLACALRGVTSKEVQKSTGMRGINLYASIAIVSSVLLLPASLLAEGSSLAVAFANAGPEMVSRGYAVLPFGAAATSAAAFIPFLLVGSVFYHTYNQTSYQALAEMSPLTHSIANTVKRVVIIVASVFVFQNKISPMGWAAACMAIFGTFLYSLARQREVKMEVCNTQKDNVDNCDPPAKPAAA